MNLKKKTFWSKKKKSILLYYYFCGFRFLLTIKSKCFIYDHFLKSKIKNVHLQRSQSDFTTSFSSGFNPHKLYEKVNRKIMTLYIHIYYTHTIMMSINLIFTYQILISYPHTNRQIRNLFILHFSDKSCIDYFKCIPDLFA